MEKRTFTLSETETKRANEFRELHKHAESFARKNKLGFSSMGNQFTYLFTPGGLGNIVQIRCNHCKATENITDSENW